MEGGGALDVLDLEVSDLSKVPLGRIKFIRCRKEPEMLKYISKTEHNTSNENLILNA